MSLRIETFAHGRAAPLIPALSRLRQAVFRDWPYLYRGTAAEEEEYLAPFIKGPSAALKTDCRPMRPSISPMNDPALAAWGTSETSR